MSKIIAPPPPKSIIVPAPPDITNLPKDIVYTPLTTDKLTLSQFHDYQTLTVNHLLSHQDAMIWLGLGLGKTVTTLTAFKDLRTMGLAKKMLVVAPLRVCELQWEQEAHKWEHLFGQFKFAKMIGTSKKRQTALFSEADIYMVNYESLRWLTLQLDYYFVKQGTPIPFDTITFDEISKMKRSESARFEAFKPLIAEFNRHWGLTASPASNGLQNLWAQYFCVDNGERLGEEYSQFIQRFFHKEGGEYGKYIPYKNEGDGTGLDMSSKQMIVNKIKDITLEIPAEGNLDMPPFNVLDIHVALPPGKMKQYVKLEKDFFVELDNGAIVEPFNSAALASKLLQFSNGIVYNYPEEDNPEFRVEEFVHDKKYQALDDIMTESGDEPIFLAYNFSSEREELLKRYPDARCMTGVSEEEAVEIQDLFNTGQIKLLIAHPLSAGHGLNLQYACSIIVWFGLNYNLELYEQFIGRIHRQGQKNPVRCFRILSRDTIDLAVRDALNIKDIVQKDIKERMRTAEGGASMLDEMPEMSQDDLQNSVLDAYRNLKK